MKQRVALARVLAFEPRILLMDEPFGALDAQTRELMQEELNAIWQQTRNTVLFVTHDIDEAIYLGDRVIVFTARPGRLKDEIRIDLPRPRSIEVKKSGEYLAYRNRVWDSLRAEVLKAREDMPMTSPRRPATRAGADRARVDLAVAALAAWEMFGHLARCRAI